MKFVWIALAGSSFTSLAAAAQNPVERRQMDEVARSVDRESRARDRMMLWQHTQGQALRRGVSPALSAPLDFPYVTAEDRERKCFPWGWEGGERGRLAVAVAAEVCLAATLSEGLPLEQMKSEVSAMGGVDVFAFNSQLKLLGAEAYATAPMQGDPTVDASVSIFGNQVWSDSVKAPSVNWSKKVDLASFDRTVSKTFLVGPFPASVSVGARGTATAQFAATLSVGNAKASALPSAQSTGYAYGGLDATFLKGGVEANVNIVNDNLLLEGKVGLLIDPVTQPPRLMYAAEATGHNQLSALAGNIDVVAKSSFSIPGLGNDFRFPIFSGKGFSSEGYVFHERVEPTEVKF